MREGRLRLLYVAPERFASEAFRRLLAGLAPGAVRRRRGPLRLGVGPRFPARLPRARRRRPRLPPGGRGPRAAPDPRVHRHGHARGPPGHRGDSSASRTRRSSSPASTGRISSSTSGRCRARSRSAPSCPSSSGRRRALVYAATRKSAARAAEALQAAGIAADAYHAGMEEADRTRVQNRFADGTLSRRLRHQRVRDGHRPARHRGRRALRDPRLARGLLPGDRTRRARRPPRRRHAALELRGRPDARVPDRAVGGERPTRRPAGARVAQARPHDRLRGLLRLLPGDDPALLRRAGDALGLRLLRKLRAAAGALGRGPAAPAQDPLGRRPGRRALGQAQDRGDADGRARGASRVAGAPVDDRDPCRARARAP